MPRPGRQPAARPRRPALAQAAGLAAHRRRRGTMLPTNLCLLTSTYEKPHLAHHPAWMRRGVAVSRTGDPLRRTAHVCAAEPLTPPSPPRSFGATARADDASLTRWPSSSPPRSRDRSRREGEPRRLPSSKSPRPATPFRTPGSDLPPSGVALAPLRQLRDAFSPRRDLADLRGRAPVHASRCRRIALLGPRLRLPISADWRTTRGFTLASVRPSRRELP